MYKRMLGNAKELYSLFFLPILLCTFAFLFLNASNSYAQLSVGSLSQAQLEQEDTEEEPFIFRDEYKRDTPRSTVEGFLAACQARNYVKAAQFLDLRDFSEEEAALEGPRFARQLKIVLDQKLHIKLDEIDATPEGKRDDGLKKDQEIIGVIQSKDKTFDIMLERGRAKDKIDIWLFSRPTIENIPDMFKKFKLGILGHFLPMYLFEQEFLGIKAAEWISMVIVLIGVFLGIFIVTGFLQRLVEQYGYELVAQLLRMILWPLRFLLTIMLFRYAFSILAFSVTTRALIKAGTFLTIAAVWFFIRLCDFFFLRWEHRLQESNKSEKAVLVTLLQKVFTIVIIFAGIMFWLENVGFRISTILAGIGVGGIAVALAAQKSLEDIFGAITILGSRPIRIGDFIRFGDTVGTVEEIGLRFTKIRTLDRTAMYVVNSKISSMDLENFGQRDKILYRSDINVRYETTANQLRYILLEIRKLFYAHPKVLPDPARIRLKGFSAYGLVLDVFVFIDTRDINEFYAIMEDILFRIKSIIEASGTQLAYPTQIERKEEHVPPDPKLTEKVDQTIWKWEKEGKLFLTDFPAEEIKKLRGTIEYPPKSAK